MTIAERHLRELHASAIADEVITERGYRTVTDVTELLELGFADYQARPGLLIPLHGPDGSNSRYALKPNEPRAGKGKYDYPEGQPPILDVPPRCLEQLGDASVPVMFTEGAKKADCLAGLGYCAVNIWGVFSWAHRDRSRLAFDQSGEASGLLALPDWQHIPLDGRTCYLEFDSDAWRNPQVALALRRLANWLTRQGALVSIVHLPDEPDGSKNGADDYVARHGDEAHEQLVVDAEPWGSVAMVRKLQAEIHELRAQLSAQAAVLRNPQMRERDKVVAVATISEAGWRESTGAPTPFVVHRSRLAEATGLKPDAVGQSLTRLSGDDGLFVKTVTRTSTEEGDPRSVIKLAPRVDGGVIGLLKAAATYAPTYTGERGGKRPRACSGCGSTDLIRRDVCRACGHVEHEQVLNLHFEVSADEPFDDAENLNLHFEVSDLGEEPDEHEILKLQNEVPTPAVIPRPSSVLTVPRFEVSASRRQRKTSVFDCRVCLEQMIGRGPRCLEHNPPPTGRAS